MAELTHILKKVSADNDSLVVTNDEDVKRIQIKLLEILDDVIACCDENDIPWQFSGGSALGAVRHKGYIPWDDDLDLNMTRDAFEKFTDCFTREYGEKYWFHIPGVTPGYDRLTPRIISKKVRARDIFNCERVECGLWVDIFVMENSPDNSILRKIHGAGCMGFRYLLSCVRFVRNEEEFKSLFGDNEEFHSIASHRTRIGKVLSILPLSFWMSFSKKWIEMFRKSDTENVVIISGSKQYFDEIYYKKTMCDTTNAQFEGRTVKISADYDNYMKSLYGDYMKIPPVEEREQHVFMELDRDALYS